MTFIVDTLVGLGKSIVDGIKGHFEHKRRIKEAVTEAKLERLKSQQSHDQKWELLQIQNSGWKDDVLFYFFIGIFIWSGFFPEAAVEFFDNLKILPDWFVKTWMWLVASVIGVKKLGDYGPKVLKEMKDAVKK